MSFFCFVQDVKRNKSSVYIEVECLCPDIYLKKQEMSRDNDQYLGNLEKREKWSWFKGIDFGHFSV